MEMTYEEAVEVYNGLINEKIKAAFEYFAPELRESEDERIRKELVEKISNLACGCFISQEQKQRYLAYLEKQKEQKVHSPEDKVKHPLYVEGFEAGKEVGRQCEKVFGEQKPVRADFRSAVKNLMNLYKIKNKFTEEDYDFHANELLELIEQKPIDIDFVSVWLRKHIKRYLNSEYNEFHKAVEYDGSIDIEHLIEDLKKAIEQQHRQ